MALSSTAKAGAVVGTLLLIAAVAISVVTLVKVFNIKDSSSSVQIVNVTQVVDPAKVNNVYPRPVQNSQAYQDAAAYFAYSVNTSVNPCDDFYQYACGNYNKTISFDVVDTNNYHVMAAAFLIPNASDPWPVQQVKTMYNQCLKDSQNMAALVGNGSIVTNAVNVFMDQTGFGFPALDGSTAPFPNATSLGNALGLLSGYFGIDTLIAPYVDTNWRDPSGNMPYMLYIDQSALTQPWTYYIGATWDITKAQLQPIILDLFNQYAKLLKVTPDAAQLNKDVDDILAFEYMLANNYSTDDVTRWQSARSYNLRTVDSFEASFIDIKAYFQKLTFFSPNATKLVAKTGYQFSLAEAGQLNKISAVFATGFNNTVSARTFYNYLIYRIILSNANYFPSPPAKNEFLEMAKYHKPTQGRPSFIRRPRGPESVNVDDKIVLNCVGDTVFLAMQYANARVFIDQIYPTAASRVAIRQSIQKVVDGILIGMQSMIDQLSWMTPNSKTGAYGKIKNLIRNYAYPDFITDDGRLTQYYKDMKNFTGKNYYQILTYNTQFMLKKQFDLIVKNRGVDRANFNGPPGTVNAWYQPELNSITFPAAILQRPYFDPEWPASINYGALGVVAGHELTHSFDSSGTQWDGLGQLIGWLDDSTQSSFNDMTSCVSKEYSGFCPLKNTNYTPSCINGQQTVGENVADNGGIHSAYRAYRNAINFGGSEPLLPGSLVSTFTHDQIFFLSFAQVWCQVNPANDKIYKQLLVDPHSLAKYRVFGTLQNYPGFQNAFNCPVGSAYAPKDHCSVWISDVNITTPANQSTVNSLNVPAASNVKADNPLYFKYQAAQQYFKSTANITADPCNDFYNYACGSTTLPLSFYTYRNKNYQMMGQEYEKIIAPGYNGDLVQSSAVNKTIQYYTSCKTTNANLNALIQNGQVVQTILDEFSTYTGLTFNWFNGAANTLTPATLAKAMAFLTIRYQVDTLVTPFVDVKPNNGTNMANFKGFVLYYDQNTAVYSKSYYQPGAWNLTYPAYLNNSQSLLNNFAASIKATVDSTQLQINIQKMIEFEHTIAVAPYTTDDTTRRIYSRWVNPMKVSDIPYKFVDWKVLTQALNDLSGVPFAGADAASYYISVAEQDPLKKLDDLFATANFDQDIVVKYLYFRLLTSQQKFVYVPPKSKSYTRLYPEHGHSGSIGKRLPTPDPFERAAASDFIVTCVIDTLANMQYTNARIFTELLYPNTDSQTKIRSETNKVVTAIKNAMQSMLNDLPWLDETSQVGARNKIQQLQLNIAYPDFILDNKLLDGYYSTLNFGQKDDYFAMLKKLYVFNRYQMYANLTQDVPHRNDFLGPPGTVNAWYQPELNSITIPEGILQQPYFDPDWPASIKFGALGVILGHELGHGFDDQGVQWDGTGQLNMWMTNASYTSFLNMTKCVVDEYSSFQPLDNTYSPNHINGYNTQGENVADNGGIHSGWRAYRKWIALNGPDPQLPDLTFGQFTHDQLFFLSFAQVWCQTPPTQAETYHQILTDPHSPSYYRVFGTIQNFPAFRTAFNCPLGSVYAPATHCHVWVP